MNASASAAGRPVEVGPAVEPASGSRLLVLDVLRGVALCGIIWLNVPSITAWTSTDGPVTNVAPWLEPLLRGRFIGIFASLFGISFALVLASASRRSPRPRLVVARRFGFLLLLGLAHAQLQQGEVLTSYAAIGLVVLLPLSFLRSTWPVVILGAAALAAPLPLHLDPSQNAAGLMILGYAAARLGLPNRLERPGPVVRIAAGLAAVGAATAVVLQHTVTNAVVDGVADAYSWADYVAGVLGAAAITLVVALLLQTRLKRALTWTFAPLGRLALTNYVSATVISALVGHLLISTPIPSTGPDLLLSAVILLVQLPASRWWLTRYRYGPLEWVWRCVTWWQLVPNRRRGQADPPSASCSASPHVGDPAGRRDQTH